jgi:transposase InsO family protein
MRYRFIQAEKASYPVEVLCRVLTVARSGYYAWCRRPLGPRAQQNQGLLTQIRTCYQASRGCYGSPRIHHELRAHGLRVGRHRVARLMRVHGLRSVRRPRSWRQPADALPAVVRANVLRRAFTATRPNEKWAADITYVPTRQGWLYLAVVIDLYSRRVVGWAMDAQQTTALTVTALEMALRQRPVLAGLLHHSDRGSQYGAMAYQQQLAIRGIRCSMSRPGNCWDNAVVESFFATLKTELRVTEEWNSSRQHARTAIFEYVEGFYNRTRRHSTLGYLSPVEFEERAAHSTSGVH